MIDSLTIRKIKPLDIDDIYTISNTQLGDNYLSKKELTTCINNKNTIGIVALQNKCIVGFALGHFFNINAISDFIFEDQNWFINYLKNASTIAILKTFAVHENYSKKGVGGALVQNIAQLLTTKSDKLIAVAWKQNQTRKNITILEKSGLIKQIEIKEYWKKDSIKKGYCCAICGNPPCMCNALIYTN